MGYIVDEHGHRANPNKTKAVLDAPRPRDVSELRSYLGMLQYYARFLPNLAAVLAPLHQLLRKGERWCWDAPQEEAFCLSKQLLCSADLLVYYDPAVPLQISCDASPTGIGAVLTHVFKDGERPIAYASRSLSKAEQNYSQLDREALAIAFAVKKYHNYLCGREFSITTDHKPLLGLLGEGKSLPELASPRMLRWALMMQGYKYALKYRPGPENQSADCLSRLPLKSNPVVPLPGETVNLLNALDRSPVTSGEIAQWTQKDRILTQVARYVRTGWPSSVGDNDLEPFVRIQDELSLDCGCILRGVRVVVPPPGRQKLLSDLHEGHPGVCRMKELARSYLWWPNIDSDIESYVRSCDSCQSIRPDPPRAPLHP